MAAAGRQQGIGCRKIIMLQAKKNELLSETMRRHDGDTAARKNIYKR